MASTPLQSSHGKEATTGSTTSGATMSGVRGFQFGTYTEQQQNEQQQQNTVRSEVITFGNPLYLNPNEALNQSIGTEVFDGTNYTMWSRSVIMGLKMKHKLGFIDGSIAMPPPNDAMFLLWDGCNTAVLKLTRIAVNYSCSCCLP
ncbi:unnamed protein product [Linum trigynum]|uniref:Retrotransposon Copia-like N-terminal domain-containing protein n=1 Tax=Linum trigynum TaxID=586398 RepID=A0AAV2FHG0_9ROSI